VKWLAYFNWGRWVADCPRPCGSAMELTPGQEEIACRTCQCAALVEWPDNAPQISTVLAERPQEQHRNWYPKNHPLAIRGSIPHGQTVKQLQAETRERMAPPGVYAFDGLGELRDTLRVNGFDVADDGKTLRRI
jgi:hypothetical protein